MVYSILMTHFRDGLAKRETWSSCLNQSINYNDIATHGFYYNNVMCTQLPQKLVVKRMRLQQPTTTSYALNKKYALNSEYALNRAAQASQAGPRRRPPVERFMAGELLHAYSLELAFFNLAFDDNSLDSLGSIDHLRAQPRTPHALVDVRSLTVCA